MIQTHDQTAENLQLGPEMTSVILQPDMTAIALFHNSTTV